MTDFRMLLPDEAEYATWMQKVAEPYLASISTEGYFKARDGKYIHYEYECPEGAKGAVVIAHGYTESAEKFRELAYWLLQMGYAVFALDHRGHGLSYRMHTDTALTDVVSFHEYVQDLHCFVRRIVLPNAGGLPLCLFGHSMGGAVSILYLQEHPGIFRKAILNAPMLRPKTEGIPTLLTKAMTGVFRFAGRGDRIVFVKKPGFNTEEDFKSSADTSLARFEYYRQKRVKNRHLQNSYPTYRWLYESLSVQDRMLDRRRCKEMKLPILLFSAGIDDFVHRREQEIFISRVPKGEIVYAEDAKHEIYMSTNDVLVEYLGKIEDFLEQEDLY